MGNGHQLIGSLGQLEGGGAEVDVAQLLVDLRLADAIQVVDGEVQARACVGSRRARQCREGCLLQLEDTHREISPFRRLFLLGREFGFLACHCHKQQQDERQ